jgi:hypothetical protein
MRGFSDGCGEVSPFSLSQLQGSAPPPSIGAEKRRVLAYPVSDAVIATAQWRRILAYRKHRRDGSATELPANHPVYETGVGTITDREVDTQN